MVPARSPRVAFVCPFGLRPKATVRARALPMAQALRRLGFQTALFVPPWDDPASAGTRFTEGGVPVVQVAGGPVAMLIRLTAEVARYRPDIVHVVKPIAHAGAVAWLLRQRRLGGRRPAFVLDADDWEGYGGWNDRLPHPWWQKRLAAAQERWAYRHADAVIVASDALRAIALTLGATAERVHHVPNGLAAASPEATPDAIEAVRARLGAEAEVVLLYTRFVEFPPDWPVDFALALRRRRPKARLLVLGEGLRGEHTALAEAATARGADDALCLAGWPGQECVPAHVAVARLAVVPFADTLVARTKSSVKLLELMALGAPILASAVGENSHYLDFGRCGRLIGGLDADPWAAEAARLLACPEERECLGMAARTRFHERYTWQRLAPAVAAVYGAVL